MSIDHHSVRYAARHHSAGTGAGGVLPGERRNGCNLATVKELVVAVKNGFDAVAATMLLLGMTLALAHAHDPATLDSLPSGHGGQVRMAGPFHIELVILGREAAEGNRLVLVYLQNHMFEDVSSGGLKGVVKFLDGQRVTTVSLVPIEANGFSGRGAFEVNPSVIAEVSITDKDGEVWSATYTPFAVKAPNARTSSLRPKSNTAASACEPSVAGEDRHMVDRAFTHPYNLLLACHRFNCRDVAPTPALRDHRLRSAWRL
jgi:hypothetical protein